MQNLSKKGLQMTLVMGKMKVSYFITIQQEYGELMVVKYEY